MFWRTKKTANQAAAASQNIPPQPGGISHHLVDMVKQPQQRQTIDIKGALSARDLEKIAETFHRSPIVHALLQIENATANNAPIQEWELDMAKKTFEEFLAKHDSPLAKALK